MRFGARYSNRRAARCHAAGTPMQPVTADRTLLRPLQAAPNRPEDFCHAHWTSLCRTDAG